MRESCGGCGSADLHPFLDLGSTPLADAFPAEPGPEKRYPLRVAVCMGCWLVQLLDVVPDHELYGEDYGFYSSSSPSITAYDEAFARWAHTYFPDEIRRGVVEIACNDGSLLRHFAAAGGVEPAAGPAKVAAERGLDVLAEPFTRAVAERIRDDRTVGLVIAKNVAAHVADLHDFFSGVAHLIGKRGVAVVEVQYLADLLLGNQFDHVYHEHRYYFSCRSLAGVLAQHGLHLASSGYTPAQGGSIRAIVQADRTGADYLGEGWLRRKSTYFEVQGRAEHLRDRLVDLIDRERNVDRTVAGYGASAKSTTLLNWCRIGPDRLAYVEDTTPHKIGRYTPGTHIPITAPGDRPDTYLLLVWNYLADVLRRERDFTANGGRFILPIPVPVLL